MFSFKTHFYIDVLFADALSRGKRKLVYNIYVYILYAATKGYKISLYNNVLYATVVSVGLFSVNRKM